jgi:predicted oxidoreductase
MVDKHWQSNRSRPGRLLIGSGQFATGTGYELAAGAGARLQRMDRQVTFVNGIPDPRDSSDTRGLTVTNRQAILINDSGQRFVDESLSSKALEQAVFKHVQTSYWMVFDAAGARKLGVRGAAWLNTDSVRSEIVQNSRITVTADTVGELAERIGVLPANLQHSIDDYNQNARRPLAKPAYYALQLYPLTRKSLGGPAVSDSAEVLNADNEAIPGLYAAGELTGVAGINGSYGGSGTFLGPSVYLGRIAGRAAAANSSFPAEGTEPEITNTPSLNLDIDGYWHYKVVHNVVQAREQDCETCHKSTPMAEVGSSKAMLTRLSTCETCH